MAITFALVAQMPHRLVYTATRVDAGGILVAVIPNAGGASPDLLTDAPATTPLGSVFRTAAASQAAARALLTQATNMRVNITPMTTGGSVTDWAVDAQTNGGLPTVLAGWSNTAGVGVNGDVALIEIEFLYVNHQWPPI